MNTFVLVCLTYAVYLLEVGVILLAAWYSEKLDPENDLPPSIWDEILPPDRSAGGHRQHPNPFGLHPALPGGKP